MGNHVTCIDVDAKRIAMLRQGVIPFFEKGLGELVEEQLTLGRLDFTTETTSVVGSRIVFVCVGTPQSASGDMDTSMVESAVITAGRLLGPNAVLVIKSTVPVGTADRLERHLAGTSSTKGRHWPVMIASNPEFLREGSVVEDFFHPDRVVIGATSVQAARLLEDLYRPLGAPVVLTDRCSAEMIKLASNAFLGTKISFINEVSKLCELLGGDVQSVAQGIGLDRRIGRSFLQTGVGFGGPCLVKDLSGLLALAAAKHYTPPVLQGALSTNEKQVDRLMAKLEHLLGSLRGATVGVLGLAFKPGTSDLRSAPSLGAISRLLEGGARVKAHDPEVRQLPYPLCERVELGQSAYDAASGCDALILVTEWEEYRHLDFSRLKRLMRQPNVVDGRNLWCTLGLPEMGYHYLFWGVEHAESAYETVLRTAEA
jgi:UDPglucose 6-dehydrogenase